MRVRVWMLVLAAGSAVSTARAADAPPSAETTFESTRPGEVLVPATLAGQGPYRFLLDTGSTHTAISARLAAALAAPIVARTHLLAAAGTIECVVVRLPALGVGPATADGLTATALPSAADAVLGGADGVLGQDFLARFTYTIDYRRGRIRWHDEGYAPAGPRLALAPAQDRWVVELRQAGEARVRRFVPDSGADTIVLFDGRAAAAPGAGALASLTGARGVRTATVSGLHVGPVRLDGQLAAVLPARRADDPDGLLPLHLFASVFFNARDGYLVIQPR